MRVSDAEGSTQLLRYFSLVRAITRGIKDVARVELPDVKSYFALMEGALCHLGGRIENPKSICHCLLFEDEDGLVLIDTGIGLLDVQKPLERIGQPLIDMAGFQFYEED